MTTGNDHALERLSAALDGEVDTAELGKACADWSGDPRARERWHCYRLIGDVLRSDELSTDGSRDAAFLKTLRARLADEPVVLAPAAVSVPKGDEGLLAASSGGPRSRSRVRSWSAPAAVAAGFMLVAGVLVSMQPTPPSQEGPLARSPLGPVPAAPAARLAAAPMGQAIAPVTPVAASAAQDPAMVADGQMLRDARLQQYLAAHKQFGGSTALGVPSGFLRSVTVDHSKR